MKHQFNDDHDILKALYSKEPASVSAALKHLLSDNKLKGAIRKQVYALGGDENNVPDVLNQALLAFYNQTDDGKYNPALSSITTYVVNIATQMYYTRRRSENRRAAMHDRSIEAGDVETFTNPEQEMSIEYRKELLDKVLHTTGGRCHQALRLQSFSYSMAEIAEKMNYKSADVAKMALLDCRKKLNNYLSGRPDLLAELRTL